MLLHFTGKEGSATIPWVAYAILRDNIQHHAEATGALPPFEAIHAIERAVDEGTTAIDAHQLHQELVRAWYALAQRKPGEIALGNRTIAVMFGASVQPDARNTVSVLKLGLSLPKVDGGYLCNLFETTFARLLSATATAVPGDLLTVTRLAYTKMNRPAEPQPEFMG